MNMEQWWCYDCQRKTEELGEKSASLQLHPSPVSLEANPRFNLGLYGEELAWPRLKGYIWKTLSCVAFDINCTPIIQTFIRPRFKIDGL
jgi:hypothetical protein